MPRRPNPLLEEKILDAAHRLWQKGGEKAVTLRAVARQAGSNTPAVYRRFRDRDDIIRGLLHRFRLELAELMQQADTPEQACERYLDYALTHRHEYERFYRYNYALDHSAQARRAGIKVGRPARNAMAEKLAKKFGGNPGEYETLLMALWMMAHGTAMLLITKSIPPEDQKTARTVFKRSVQLLLGEQRKR